MVRRTESEIMHNAQQKVYPDGSSVILVSDRRCFREPGWESDKPLERSEGRERGGEDIERSKRRARASVTDLARCNDFAYFVTLTLDAARVDRYDIAASLRPMRVMLDNAVRRHGLRYILVPEHHKDGAIHFHGLINAGALELVDSGTLRLPDRKQPKKPRSKKERAQMLENGAQIVYNIPDWKLGFSTAIELYGDRNAAIAYVCKYIGKEAEKIGGRWYYSGGKLLRPEKRYFDLEDYAEIVDGEHSFTIPRLGCRCWKIETEV